MSLTYCLRSFDAHNNIVKELDDSEDTSFQMSFEQTFHTV